MRQRILSSLLGLVLASCAVPNPLEQSAELMAPARLTLWYDGTRLQIEAVGLATEERSPDWSGWAIFLDRTSQIERVLERNLLSDQGTFPALAGKPSSGMQTLTLALDRLRISNANSNATQLETVAVNEAWYVTARAYDRRNNRFGSWTTLVEVRIPTLRFDQTLAENGSWTADGFGLLYTNGRVVPQGGTVAQAGGTPAEWLRPLGLPASNYSTFGFQPLLSNVVFLQQGSNYAKIYFTSVASGSVRFHGASLVGSSAL